MIIRKVAYSLTIVNLFFQIVYMTIGVKATSELGGEKILLYFFRPEYMVISGGVALIFLFVIMALLIKSIRQKLAFCIIMDIIMVGLNIEYVLYYVRFLSLQ